MTEAGAQFALRIALEGAELAAPTDAQLAELARHAGTPGAVLPADQTHFVKWIDGRTPQEIERQRIARVQSNRDLAKRPGWTLDLAVLVDGAPVGLQSVSGFEQWPQRRIVGTTSWLIAPFQGRGLGIRARAAVLELAFGLLGAEAAKSWALEENTASIAVSTSLGYRFVDSHILVEDGRELIEHVYELRREDWLGSAARRRYPPVITGADALIRQLAI
ncbi:GNAT family N-acetyltransferase [Mycolicibacterium sp. P9-22]|uniref:GNAT family N-acetyltransferase n=1 Tax=Mycolicibacterium sp. P9-22 TaxID=2024613 RepID=UPI0011ECF67E|nr:GNAT family protein [Mycolicibacterium sp. P9-22]KAA0114051.1 N-acetyltransferase [Mycolicibacterium sp. P9-22]